MVYYYDILSIFLFFFFFLLILIILFPGYTKKDIVPPLSDANYVINPPTGVIGATSNSITFSKLVFNDGVGGENGAIDFGPNMGADTAEISYVPYYTESDKRLIGYFDINIGTSLSNSLAFRVIDENFTTGTENLYQYNKGWASLTTPSTSSTYSSTPIYNVKVPFNLPGYSSNNHKLTVQISKTIGSGGGLELSSAYLYYNAY